jgi:hypothetical protein
MIRAWLCSVACIDIGTPERYRDAQKTLATAELDGAARDE